MGMKQDPPSFPRMHLRRRTRVGSALTRYLAAECRQKSLQFIPVRARAEVQISPGRFRRICDLHTGLAKSNIRSGVRFRECL